MLHLNKQAAHLCGRPADELAQKTVCNCPKKLCLLELYFKPMTIILLIFKISS
jgi:hypothetical protein